ncbi:MAG: hypothetical protein HY711_00270 [Candidatus Melainabacteria bacterium]|nr:hypothetical protein [Candidatus Melainabacteria bacterium]
MSKASEQGTQRAKDYCEAASPKERTAEEVESVRAGAVQALHQDLVGFQKQGDKGKLNEELRAYTQALSDKGVLPKMDVPGSSQPKKVDVVGTTTDKDGVVVAMGRKPDGRAEQVLILGSDAKYYEASAVTGPDGSVIGYKRGKALSEQEVANMSKGLRADGQPLDRSSQVPTQAQDGTKTLDNGAKITREGGNVTKVETPGTNGAQFGYRYENGQLQEVTVNGQPLLKKTDRGWVDKEGQPAGEPKLDPNTGDLSYTLPSNPPKTFEYTGRGGVIVTKGDQVTSVEDGKGNAWVADGDGNVARCKINGQEWVGYTPPRIEEDTVGHKICVLTDGQGHEVRVFMTHQSGSSQNGTLFVYQTPNGEPTRYFPDGVQMAGTTPRG